jgi:hypothetical protein
MLDAGFRVTFRHFWTLFFVAAALTVPLHLIYVFTFHRVIAVRELAPQIERFPATRQVHLVGPSQIRRARLALWLLDAVEIALLPLAVRAARAVIEMDEKGEVPTAAKAWRDAFRRQHGTRLPEFGGALLVALLAALAVGGLLDAIGRLIAEPFGANWSFAILGLTQGAARAAGAAFVLGTAAVSSHAHAPRDVVSGGVL